MENVTFNWLYKDVPPQQKEELRHFRLVHPARHLQVDGFDWEYLCCGKGSETLVILPGGLRSGEAAFRIILALENEFQVIAPTYPPAPVVAQWAAGVRAILDAVQVEQAHIFGSSAGGMLAQVFVRKYPQRVKSLILGDTSLPDRERGARYARRKWIFSLIPIWYVRRMGKRGLPRLVSALPEDRRAFWLAYLSELLDRIYTRAWLTAGNQVGIDYMLNYTFHPDDLREWPGKVLIIDSDDDTVIGLEQLKLLKAMYSQAQVYTFHNAGHVPAITHEAEYIQLLKNFLKVEEVGHVPNHAVTG